MTPEEVSTKGEKNEIDRFSEYVNIVLRGFGDLLEGVGSLGKRFKDY